MNEFKEKWNTDYRFRTKIKLSLYTLFVILVGVFAISNRSTIPLEKSEIENDNQSQKEENNDILKIPNEYNYTINIKINDKEYDYIGTKTFQRESITKKVEDTTINYIYENDNYYKEINENYILSTKEEVYDIVNYDYINLSTINEYLSKSNKEENRYLVYLKDIILGNNSNDCITITINQDNFDIDYTSLSRTFDKTIEKYIVNIEIESIE